MLLDCKKKEETLKCKICEYSNMRIHCMYIHSTVMGIVTATLLHNTLIFLETSHSFIYLQKKSFLYSNHTFDIFMYWIYTSALHSLLDSSDSATFPASILPHLSFSSTLAHINEPFPCLLLLTPVFF